MRSIPAYLFFIFFYGLKAQDKIYFLNGSSKECMVIEVAPEEILVETEEDNKAIPRADILLIQFKNGVVEIINTPKENAVYNPQSKTKPANDLKNITRVHKQGNLSVNTLALCNADISVFYEYITTSRRLGLGLMGAYNFNLNSTAQNSFISLLPNAKKNFDMGATLNFYPGRFTNRTTFYIGGMIKYTSFNFIYSKDTSARANGIVSSSVSKGSQLATLLTVGSHTFFGDHFFIKTIGGLGIFRLKGDYKDQFNFEINRNSTGKPAEFNFLPKLYLGLNIGFNF